MWVKSKFCWHLEIESHCTDEKSRILTPICFRNPVYGSSILLKMSRIRNTDLNISAINRVGGGYLWITHGDYYLPSRLLKWRRHSLYMFLQSSVGSIRFGAFWIRIRLNEIWIRILLSLSKNSKTLIPTVLWLLNDVLPLKTDANVAPKSKKQKNLKLFLVAVLTVADENIRIWSRAGSESGSVGHAEVLIRGSGSVLKCHGSATLHLRILLWPSFSPMFRDGVGQHVRGVGEDDLLLDVLQPVHVDPRRPCRPAGQGLLLRTLDSPPTVLSSYPLAMLRIRYPVPFWLIRNRFFPDLGSRIPNPYFWELSDIFLGKKFYNSLKVGPNYFLQHFKNKNFFSLSLLSPFLDPGSGMGKNQDPGFGINIPDPQHCPLDLF